MAGDLLELLPLFPDDDEAAILARMRADANEGLDPEVDADRWVDTREGSFWHIAVMPTVRRIAMLYDLAGTEVPAAGFAVWAWADYLDDHAAVQNIVRLAATRAQGTVTFTGAPGTTIAAGQPVGVEPVGEDDPAPEFTVDVGGRIPGGGSLDLTVTATDAGEAGNVGALAITVPGPGLVGVDVSNADPTQGGTEAETDESLRGRVLNAYIGQGAGNRNDYERWARAWDGVGRVTVIPLWNGPGTVKVVVTTADGQPVSPATVAALQADLDPTAGRGDGQAPVGAHVTVETATALDVTIAASIEFERGYTLDGVGGTVALGDEIDAAVRNYVERVEPGGEVVIAKVAGVIVTVPGVHDVSGVRLNGGAANVPVDDDPAQIPSVVEPMTLTEV